jgi:hypothetical protein
LFGKRLRKLLVGNQAHALGQFAQELAGAALLLVQQQLELVIGDKAEIDENLTDASNCHGALHGVVWFYRLLSF